MASTEPHSPNLRCRLCSLPWEHRAGQTVLPYGPPTPCSGSPFLLPPHGLTQICFFLRGPVPWSDCVSTGVSRARKTWAWGFPFGSLFALTGWKNICSICLKKSTKTRPREKDQVWGRKSYCALYSSQVWSRSVVRFQERWRASTKGVSSWCSQAPRSVWSGSRSWLQLLSHGSSASRGLICVPI